MANYKDWYFHPQEKIVTYKNWIFKYTFSDGDWQQEATVSGDLTTKIPTDSQINHICQKAFDFFMFSMKKIN